MKVVGELAGMREAIRIREGDQNILYTDIKLSKNKLIF